MSSDLPFVTSRWIADKALSIVKGPTSTHFAHPSSLSQYNKNSSSYWHCFQGNVRNWKILFILFWLCALLFYVHSKTCLIKVSFVDRSVQFSKSENSFFAWLRNVFKQRPAFLNKVLYLLCDFFPAINLTNIFQFPSFLCSKYQ